ncbi:ABC-2 family transporter protein [Acididesulfobacillus acetoxydans]|uniref:ABC-2 family transporter protein n=1 Tax=Acididesulfobacillus acetoxydans TaxID=1561005 RepID=A0A8S0W5D3_9FIRM|nr:ABC-2 transporter permease [Acididesulfobacillus acetoxydans]CAA7603038.1 ABC-2 family transporter protein [Acididesulfobacillus acetoxydans]CEJ08997.1 ABC-2 family transporter protein [Acididesulfobacillus acetoxydans]
MFSLLLKDVLILKKQFLLVLLFILFANYFMVFSTSGIVFIPGLTVVLTYALVVQSCLLDDKANSELILLSLPLLRRDIVRTKYFSLFFYALSSILSTLIFQLIKALLSHPTAFSLTWGIFLTSIFAASLMGSVYYPFYFRLGYVKSRIISTVVFFTLFFGSSFVAGLLNHHSQSPVIQALGKAVQWLHDLSTLGSTTLTLLFILLFTGSSYLLSRRFYQRREF